MKEQLLELLKRDAWFKGEVKLASGKTSDFYIDVRRVSLSSQGSYLIARLFWDMIKNDTIFAIGGPTLGADPMVGAVCARAWEDKNDLQGFLIRKSAKEHGRQKMIEGKDLPKGSRVVVIDDVATSGGSLIKSIDVLNQAEIKVVKALTVVDRLEGAAAHLAKLNCPLESIFTRDDFFR